MMTLREFRSRLSSDAGISMAELLIYCLLLGGVMTMVGSLLINSLRTQDTVTSVVDATTAAQLGARSVEQGIRNSSTFKLTTVNTSDQLLLARVSKSDGSWTCQAWYYSNANDSLRFTQSTSIIPATAWSTTGLANWTLLVEGVKPPASAAATAPIFATSGASVTINFRVDAGDNPNATISSSASRRLSQGSTQCFT